jgi:uncharacterized protein YndB with AHSA1/START domain
MQVTREVDIEAPPEDVWEALVSEEGRERWLGEPRRDIEVEVQDEPRRLVWWWRGEPDRDLHAPDAGYDEDGADYEHGAGIGTTCVEIELLPLVSGTRVIVVESVPTFPLPALAASFALVAA